MKNTSQLSRIRNIVLIAFVSFGTAACGGGGGSASTPSTAPGSLTLSPTSVILTNGQTSTVLASQPGNASNTFTSSGYTCQSGSTLTVTNNGNGSFGILSNNGSNDVDTCMVTITGLSNYSAIEIVHLNGLNT